MSRRLLALALLVAVATPLRAQGDDMTRAMRAYQALEFEAAATLLRRALSGQLDDSTRIRALIYLGAAEHYRGRPDSAAAVFGRLVALAPQYQPDTLLFPPEITRRYNDVRSRTQVVTVVVRPDTQLPAHVAPPPPPPPPPPPAAPQAPPEPGSRITGTGAGLLVNVRSRSEAGGLPPASGTVLGMTASARLNRFELGVRYLQGSLGTRDLVEGAAALRFLAAPWLTLQAGPQIRRYETPSGAERWVTWQLGARTVVPIAGTGLRGLATLWQGFGTSVNVPPGSGSARGGELGVMMDIGSGPFWVGLGYGIDRMSVRDSNRRETVETLTVTAGLRRGGR